MSYPGYLSFWVWDYEPTEPIELENPAVILARTPEEAARQFALREDTGEDSAQVWVSSEGEKKAEPYTCLFQRSTDCKVTKGH